MEFSPGEACALRYVRGECRNEDVVTDLVLLVAHAIQPFRDGVGRMVPVYEYLSFLHTVFIFLLAHLVIYPHAHLFAGDQGVLT